MPQSKAPTAHVEPTRAPKSRSVTVATDSVSLVSRGVPSSQPLLRAGAVWELDARQPSVRGAPHFVAQGGQQELHLFMGTRGWQIAPDLDASVAYAIAPGGHAAHPNTVRQGEWHLPTDPEGAWAAHADFHVSVEGPNTEDKPFRIDQIGADFFLRIKTTKLVWFVDPISGEVMHSGAKNAGVIARPGKRYCPLCCQCFSANNFVSQHIKNLHTPAVPTTPNVVAEGDGGALLWWAADGCAPGAQPSAFSVQYSDDGGSTWRTAIANTGSADPRARIAALTIGAKYQFRVAVIALATMGPYSAASAPFAATAGAPPAEVGRAQQGGLRPTTPERADPAAAIASASATPVLLAAAACAARQQYDAPEDVVARMNASLSEMTPPTAMATGSRCAPCLGGAAAELSVPADAAAPRAQPTPMPTPSKRAELSLKRKQSFSDNLPPSLQEFLDHEIDRVLAESSADFQHAELIGDQLELKLSIPVPKSLSKELSMSSNFSASALSSDPIAELAAGLELQPPRKKHAMMTIAECASLAPSPPLTPPISPTPASALVTSLFDGSASSRAAAAFMLQPEL